MSKKFPNAFISAFTYCLHCLASDLGDTTPPVVTVPSGTITREVEVGTLGTNVFYTEPTATDDSDTVFLLSRTAQPGDFFPVGVTVVMYVFRDPSGNPATVTFMVNVVEGTTFPFLPF